MPTYRYRCRECGHEMEEFQQITAEPLTSCPACGKESLARVLGAGAGIIFKGSGFYLTDYRKDSDKKKPPKPPEGGEKGKESGKGETGKGGGTAGTGDQT